MHHTSLDGGLWLHHTLRITERHGATDVLTLTVPCTCGRGYVGIALDSEDDLLEILSNLHPTAGQSPQPTRGTRSTGSLQLS